MNLMKQGYAWCLWAVLVVACGDDEGALYEEELQADVQTCGTAGSPAIGGAGRAALRMDDPLFRPPMPVAAVFCEIEMGVSSVEDVETVLGAPRFSYDGGQGNISYTYDFDNDATLRMSFRQRLLHDASVVNMPYPACWEAP